MELVAQGLVLLDVVGKHALEEVSIHRVVDHFTALKDLAENVFAHGRRNEPLPEGGLEHFYYNQNQN